MSKNSINFVDLFDWEVESDRHYMRMMEGPYFDEEDRLPAKIEVIINSKKDDNQTNKRTSGRANKKRI